MADKYTIKNGSLMRGLDTIRLYDPETGEEMNFPPVLLGLPDENVKAGVDSLRVRVPDSMEFTLESESWSIDVHVEVSRVTMMDDGSLLLLMSINDSEEFEAILRDERGSGEGCNG